MLIHQERSEEFAERDTLAAPVLRSTLPQFSAQGLTEEERAILWDRIVRVHFLASDLDQPGLAPHVSDELTRFVTGVLREWAAQAEEGLGRRLSP